jgi:hypothetical protein
LLTTLLVAVVALFPGVATGEEVEVPPPPESVVPPVGDVELDERFTRPVGDVSLPDLPEDPVEALVVATNARSANLGFGDVDHGPEIREAGLSDEFAGRVALLMQAVLACPPLPDLESLDPEDRLDALDPEERLECAGTVSDAAAGAMQAKDEPSSGDVEAWPVLYIDGDGGDDFHVHDYSVLIDRGGDDTYDNNAGGNLLDLVYGPEGSAAPKNGRAVGCEHPSIAPPLPGLIAPPQDCFTDRQSVLIDHEGDDKYGVFKKPRQVDHNPLPEPLRRSVDGDCTDDPLVRRIMTGGAGLQGNGLLLDGGGDDKYRGKTGALGTGHVGGVGILRDFGRGDDDYLAIRNSQGFALVSGLGLLHDEGGSDRYHTYMPRPLDPDAGPQELGGGGVVDDTNRCDRIPRMVQGVGFGGFGVPSGTGYLLDEGGRDVYKGEPPTKQLFLPPVVDFRHSSQGFGCDGSTGILEDNGGKRDEYLRGPKGRKDGASITDVETECGFFPTPGVGIFNDDGPKKKKRR